MFKTAVKKVENVNFTRGNKALSLKASVIERLSTGSTILCYYNAYEVDQSGVFDLDDDDYDHVFH